MFFFCLFFFFVNLRKGFNFFFFKFNGSDKEVGDVSGSWGVPAESTFRSAGRKPCTELVRRFRLRSGVDGTKRRRDPWPTPRHGPTFKKYEQLLFDYNIIWTLFVFITWHPKRTLAMCVTKLQPSPAQSSTGGCSVDSKVQAWSRNWLNNIPKKSAHSAGATWAGQIALCSVHREKEERKKNTNYK